MFGATITNGGWDALEAARSIVEKVHRQHSSVFCCAAPNNLGGIPMKKRSNDFSHCV